MSIRQATLNDLVQMQAVFIDTVSNNCIHDYTGRQIDMWISSVRDIPRWKNIITDQYCLVAESQNLIVGFGSLAHGGYIDFLYVSSNFMRKGIATSLLTMLQEKSIADGFPYLTSDVSKTAFPFFTKMGFTLVKENRKFINGVEISNFHMSRKMDFTFQI